MQIHCRIDTRERRPSWSGLKLLKSTIVTVEASVRVPVCHAADCVKTTQARIMNFSLPTPIYRLLYQNF